MANKIVKDLNRGSVTKTMILFAMPLLFSGVIQMLYNTADMIIIGHFVGTKGLAAVSVGGDVMHFLAFAAMGFANAGQVIISQYLGAGMRERAGKLIGTLFTFLLSAALVLGILTIIFREPVLRWVNAPEGETWDFAMSYVVVCMSGMLFIYGYNIVSAILRGMGDSKHPLIFVAVAATLNVILDLLFVVVFGWKVFGVAMATVLSQAASFILSIIFLYRHRVDFGFDFKLSSFKIDMQVLAPLLKLGLPMLLQSAAISFSMLYVNRYINGYGEVAAAMNGIGNKVGMIVNIINFSFAAAASPMIGQAIGAEYYSRVPRVVGVSLAINSAISILMAVILVLFPQMVFGIFTEDEKVMDLAIAYIPVALVLLAGSALRPPLGALINGVGNFKLNFLVGILDGVVLRIGLSMVLGIYCGFGIFGFWYGHAIAGFTPFVIGSIYYLTGRWRTRKYIVN
ncbi:MAG: MATE family efflux transporter [Lentisphaerae bacterium]|nr:MATE family efflux transporter [Lentisphaerota bacterium]